MCQTVSNQIIFTLSCSAAILGMGFFGGGGGGGAGLGGAMPPPFPSTCPIYRMVSFSLQITLTKKLKMVALRLSY